MMKMAMSTGESVPPIVRCDECGTDATDGETKTCDVHHSDDCPFLQELQDAFDVFDRNKDGCICIKELDEMMRALGHSAEEAEIKEIIKKVDKNQNGTVEFHEFLSVMKEHYQSPRHSEMSEIEMKEAFKIFDHNQDGFISPKEIKETMKTMGEELTDDDVKNMMKAADIDGNNLIDYPEFKKLINAIFLRSSANVSRSNSINSFDSSRFRHLAANPPYHSSLPPADQPARGPTSGFTKNSSGKTKATLSADSSSSKKMGKSPKDNRKKISVPGFTSGKRTS